MKFKLLIVMLLLLWGCKKNGEKSDAFGNFEAESVIISSESTGKVLQLNIEKGQRISSGYLTAVIDTVQIKLKIAQIDAQKAAVASRRQSVLSQIAVFEEQKKYLKTNEKRILAMLSDGATTQKQLDEINGQLDVVDKQTESTKTQFSSISSEIEVLETQKDAAMDMLLRCLVTAPVEGTVLEIYVEQGELTVVGKPLFKMASLDELTLKVYISGAQLTRFKIGQEVDVLIDETESTNQYLTGKITWISPEAEFTPKVIQTKEERVKLVYAVKIAVKNDGRIKIGMPGEVKAKASES
jgi:HlyD family secretion protein